LGGVIDQFWLAIVAGLYGIGYLAAPAGKQFDLTLGQTLDAAEIDSRLDGLLKRVTGQLEPDALALATSIKDSIHAALPRLAAEQVQDRTAFIVRQTALDYLPATMESYLNLPVAFRRMHKVRDGKTSHDLLIEQLTLLDGKMKEILSGVLEHDTQALLTNGRFLEEKFQKTGFVIPRDG
jgi:hypothetical protein